MITTKILTRLSFFIFILFTSCSEDSVSSSDSFESSSTSTSSGSSGQGGNQDTSAGQITAGEWNDLEHWLFWTDLLNDNTYFETQTYWDFYTLNRVAFNIKDANNMPVNGALVALYKDDVLAGEARTDNFGTTNLFLNLNLDIDTVIDYQDYTLKIDDLEIAQNIIPFSAGVNEVNISTVNPVENTIEISFIVDATGSMADELEFLKNDLQDVISTVQSNNESATIATSAVFYRDYGDAYVEVHSDFSSDINATLSFIQQQSAGGGGDFPEAVEVAISKSINDLQWTENAKTKIAFLLLDAPPHHEVQIIDNIHQTLKNAAKKGIKIIPITASGIDKQTEFLMRYMSITTNGTYVFITNDSGIGNDHLEPTVGEYEVEFLNELMVRLINKYSE